MTATPELLQTRLAAFELRPEHQAHVDEEFAVVLTGTDLSRTLEISSACRTYARVPGIYFWVIRDRDRRYRLYVGKTNSLGARLGHYTSPFQPHSPNDFKLLVFCAFMREMIPGGSLELYFSRAEAGVTRESLTAEENRLIAALDPLLNRRLNPSPEAREALGAAFAGFYRSGFERLLGGG